MTDDLVERVARLYEDKWGVKDHQLARNAIALCMEEAAKVCDPKGDCSEQDAYGAGFAAAIRALKEEPRDE